LKILVVDDEPRIRATLIQCLESDGHVVSSAERADVAARLAETEGFDVVLVDVRLGHSSGLDLIPVFLEHNAGVAVVVITAYATVDTAVSAMKRGAVDYLPKPFTPAQVRLVIDNAVKRKSLEKRVESLEQQLRGAVPPVTLESNDPAMHPVIETARQVATGDATVLLLGESGTGKGVLARAVHDWSQRRSRVFSVVHTPSLPSELFESELFGHARGAFTGALRANPGRIASADGGTLFLDEIGDLPLAAQPKLLRFIQDRIYQRLGEATERHADVRIIAATNHDLDLAVREGRFRDDLYYRLNVVEIHVPPLRRRPADIVPLANRFLDYFATRYDRTIEGFTDEAESVLRRHWWPGNVRELQNTIERAVILSDDRFIDSRHVAIRQHQAPPQPQIGDLIDLRSLEAEHIRRVIRASASLDEAAETLGIDPATLWRKRRRYGL